LRKGPVLSRPPNHLVTSSICACCCCRRRRWPQGGGCLLCPSAGPAPFSSRAYYLALLLSFSHQHQPAVRRPPLLWNLLFLPASYVASSFDGAGHSKATRSTPGFPTRPRVVRGTLTYVGRRGRGEVAALIRLHLAIARHCSAAPSYSVAAGPSHLPNPAATSDSPQPYLRPHRHENTHRWSALIVAAARPSPSWLSSNQPARPSSGSPARRLPRAMT